MSTKDLLLLAFAGVGAYAAYLQVKKMKAEQAQQSGGSGGAGSSYGGTDFTSLLDGNTAFQGTKYDFYNLFERGSNNYDWTQGNNGQWLGI